MAVVLDFTMLIEKLASASQKPVTHQGFLAPVKLVFD
jgi:hypothetical protein